MSQQKQSLSFSGDYPFQALLKSLVLGCWIFFTPFILWAQEEKPTSAPEAQTDTISADPGRYNLEEKLRDPDFDVRIPSGVRLQPWHDRNSMYPRRTLPLSQLACLERKPAYGWV